MAVEYPTTAAEYLAAGWHIFPVVRGAKTPKVKEWQNYDGLTAPETDNVGVVTGQASGIIVLDIDANHGGWESLAELEKTYGALPDTLRSVTANGGAHFFFKHPGNRPIRNGAAIYDKAGVDVRGDGGYVVVPPSSLDPDKNYVWDVGSPTELADLPEWITEHGEMRVAKAAAQQDAAFPKGTRNDSLARIAGSLRHFGTPQDVLEYTLLDINKAKCNPPLPDEEVKAIAASVGRYKQGHLPTVPEAKPIMSESANDFLTKEIKPMAWLVQGIWPEQAIGFIAGPPKSFKSFVAIELAYAISAGKPFLGRFQVKEPGRVLLVQQESSRPAFQMRMRKYSERFGIPEGLFLLSNQHMNLEDEVSCERFEAEVEHLRPSLVILDPLASFIEGDENSASEMGAVVRFLRRIRDTYKTGVCVIHHTNKSGGQVTSERGGMRMRGSSAFYAATEVGLWVNRVDEESLRSNVRVELKESEGPSPFVLEMDKETCELSLNETGKAKFDEYEPPTQAYWTDERDDDGRYH